ncbi:fibronectin type III domain-containing protein [Nonomuraea roseoviolacea]|uniref:Fibronectin type-III domain-containing protein n=1 Tax=Nonomuraea roseoviolacea subsp. carminata TaxID=160689 RepID=A0ABT1K9D8_9ACTN|nr:fibronectin type III domain-containing protein [Nonomuraea roseoviolacea]MCP2350610.1 hypothetical protein [Nonomuraea roseoviolacea subsp. carminata]
MDETPKTITDQLGFFGHVAIVPGRVNPAEYGDSLLTMARYVGVLTGRDFDHLRKTIAGQSTAVWLGDADDKGDVLESPVQITAQTFPNAIRALLGAGTAVVEGTLYSGIAGAYTGRHQWQSRRKAIDYVCSTMGAEWRVNGDGKLDAGPAASLFQATPTCVIVRRRPNRHTDGDDLTMHGLRGDMALARDVDDFTTRVVVLAEGEGSSTATGSANHPANPYLDLRGQPVKRVRLISESGTAPGNANARAQIQLNRYLGTRNAMRLTTDDYDIQGAFRVGDWVWVYDPDSGLEDSANEITFRGERINPVKLRMAGASWPVREGSTVAYRSQAGVWLDLTPYVDFEGGETTVDVGELLRSLSSGGLEPVGPRPIPDSTVPGVVSWDLPFLSGVYLDALGNTRAKMLVKWLLPLNVDGSTILDGHHYEVQYGVSPASDWQTAYAPWGDLQAMILDLSPGVDYDFRIRAVDSSNNQGAWSVVETATANPDTIPPSTPTAPTVAGSRLAIQITHTLGKASGGTYNLELDLHHLEIHVGSTSGFTADASTLKGQVAAHAGMLTAGIPAIATVDVEETTARWVRVIAVDEAGNRSPASASATATALLIDDAHISNLTATKITAGTLSADIVLGARIKTADTGARVEMNASGLQMYNGAGTSLVQLQTNGQFFLRSGTTGARMDMSTVTGIQLFNAGGIRTVWLDIDGSFELRSGASGARIQMDETGLKAFNGGGTQTVTIDSSSGSFTLRSATSGARIELDTTGFRAYNSSGSATFTVSASTGDVDLTGRLTSTVSGSSARLVVNPLFGANPEIRFYRDATQYHYITSFTGDNPPAIQIGSVLVSDRKGTVQLSRDVAQLTITAESAAIISGLVAKEAGWLDFFGKMGSPGSGAAFARGLASFGAGTIGSIGYGFTFSATALPVATMFNIFGPHAVSVTSRNSGGFGFDTYPSPPGAGYDVMYWVWNQ